MNRVEAGRTRCIHCGGQRYRRTMPTLAGEPVWLCLHCHRQSLAREWVEGRTPKEKP